MINEDLLAWARSFAGVAEIEGVENNPVIMDWARILGVGHYKDDSRQEWCGLFMAFLAHVCGSEIPPSFLLARSWLSTGALVENPIDGDVVVLWRGAPDSQDGHVGLYVGQTPSHVILYGGNQVNAVREYAYEKDRILGIRRLYRKTY